MLNACVHLFAMSLHGYFRLLNRGYSFREAFIKVGLLASTVFEILTILELIVEVIDKFKH